MSPTPPEPDAGGPVAHLKRALRREARALAPAGTSADREVLRRLSALPELLAARTLALYHALPGEVPVQQLLGAAGRRGTRVLFPRVRGPELELVRVRDLRDLSEVGALREPLTGGAVDPARVDMFVVPGLLFARDGGRLGRGGGHYDRLLARARADAARVGACHAVRLRDALPAAAWDARMDIVVTELEVIRRV